MTTTTTHLYYNTIVDQPMTCAAVTCTSISASGTFSCGTNAATCGNFKSLSITASGTFSAASITSSGTISCGTNAMTCGALSCSSVKTANSSINLLDPGIVPNFNSTTVSWSWTNSTGQTYLINQRGTGVGGFSFGLYDCSDNGYTPPNPYSEFLTIAANFKPNAGERAGTTYLQTPLYVYGHGNLQPSVIGTFYSPSLLNGYYNEIQVGRSSAAYENALFAYNINTGTPQASFGEIDIAGAGATITFDGYGRVGVGQAPDSTNRLAVNGNIVSSNVSSGSWSATFTGPWSSNITKTAYWSRAGNAVTLQIGNLSKAGDNHAEYLNCASLPAAITPTTVTVNIPVWGWTAGTCVMCNLRIQNDGQLVGTTTDNGAFVGTLGETGIGPGSHRDNEEFTVTYYLH